MKEASVLLIVAILLFTSLYVFTPITKVTKAAPLFPPLQWERYNVDGGYSTWLSSNSGQHAGSYCAKCVYDYIVTPNDDWLVTKPSDVPDVGGTFSFWVKGYNYYDDTYEVYISTTGNTVDDFLLLDSGVAPSSYVLKSYSVTSYAGQTVWFAIRYTGNYAWYIWVDDVTFPDGTVEGFEEIPPPPTCFIEIGDIKIGTAPSETNQIIIEIKNNDPDLSHNVGYTVTFTLSCIGDLEYKAQDSAGDFSGPWHLLSGPTVEIISGTVNIGCWPSTEKIRYKIKEGGTACFELKVEADCADPKIVNGCAGLAICCS